MMDEQTKKMWWVIRANMWCIWVFKSLNSNFWLGGSLLEYFDDGFTSKDALMDELTYWDGE